MREKAVRELLTRHCQLTETPESWAKETFLTQKLCVPAEWIHEAKAVRAHMESDKHLEALYLFKAGHWNRCHQLVIRHLASGECKGLHLLELPCTSLSCALLGGWGRGALGHGKLRSMFHQTHRGSLICMRGYGARKDGTVVVTICHRRPCCALHSCSWVGMLTRNPRNSCFENWSQKVLRGTIITCHNICLGILNNSFILLPVCLRFIPGPLYCCEPRPYTLKPLFSFFRCYY